MSINIGIMNGRLVAPFDGRFQAFPANDWQAEFWRAKAAGLSHIEWIYEKPHEAINPVGTDDGIKAIKKLSSDSGVKVSSICADYYMTELLLRNNGDFIAKKADHLKWLICQARKLGIVYIVLPFVDASSLKTNRQIEGLINLLSFLVPFAKAAGVELHLETDLAPIPFSNLLKHIDSDYVRANYDIGNSASLGYDPTEELTLLAPYLGSVHVKDRVLGGGSVPLGTGNADLKTCFSLIHESGFNRWFILQVARGENGDEVQWSIANRKYVERCMNAVLASDH